MPDLTLNGMLEEEVGKYYHICFFTDRDGPDKENADNYVFVPKVVCRIVDDMTVAVQDWYVYKKGLSQYMRGSRRVYRRFDRNRSAGSFGSTFSSAGRKPHGAFRR